MENTEISSHAELLMSIMHLKSEKFRQEEEIVYTFKELAYYLNPITMVRGSLHELAQNKEVQFDLAKVALNLGANLVIDQVFGKYRSIKGLFRSVLIETISTTFINNNVTKIISGITKLIRRNPPQETNDQTQIINDN
jgi:hypothetical protein